MNKELASAHSKLGQERTTQEKEHLKTIFMNFIDKLSKGDLGPGTTEMLKILCALIDCSEQERNSVFSMVSQAGADKKKTGGGLMGFLKK